MDFHSSVAAQYIRIKAVLNCLEKDRASTWRGECGAYLFSCHGKSAWYWSNCWLYGLWLTTVCIRPEKSSYFVGLAKAGLVSAPRRHPIVTQIKLHKKIITMNTSTVTLMFIYLTGASKRSMFGFLSATFTPFGGDAITSNSHYPFPACVIVKTRKE